MVIEKNKSMTDGVLFQGNLMNGFTLKDLVKHAQKENTEVTEESLQELMRKMVASEVAAAWHMYSSAEKELIAFLRKGEKGCEKEDH